MSAPAHNVHEDVAAYALGVLDEEEHQAFEQHLLSCEKCQVELRELSEVPDLLDALRERRSDALSEDRTSH
ncbi:zf-HC2 domain-containing protein [Planomonospora sp. ID67723]|uniref:zf-HC2 domain-containing protein n=1 Tax=Planomonospora sp. ID67723 TaxID=2738134 RepID=UPI0018C42254|nr:zf-HC2 domain-containing protein [Planomonospora sp. ID67723]MBG0828158.1 zf-HC2 domain-containing protein [Planomonospora sp. ID67723]